MRGSSVEASKENLRRVFVGALLMNWRVWTVTQWLSFHYVPPQLRVLWGALFGGAWRRRWLHWETDPHSLSHICDGSCGAGNAVALWWNSYLSLTQN